MNTKVESFQDLVVWQKSHKLAQSIFKSKFTGKEGKALAEILTVRIIAIPSNLAIGFKKRGKKAKIHYYREALTALQDVSYLFLLAKDLECLKNMDDMSEDLETIERMIKRLIRLNAQN